ncbi:unique cartilage matrix-associated protein-like [Gouania willdenowi]|uniref:unique cartilage matrix-associated protein-like n=1 Tax=Gouania willdenowi TaxID=441366 RepID=UPI001056C6E3|nr:unique cartilage matrix-associated protein-like [Gouania willdenowi]
MTWKTAFVQLLVINALVSKVYRATDGATISNATESEGNKTAEGTAVTKTNKHKGVPLKVFVTEIDASKFFKNRNTCSIVYCFGPRDYEEDQLTKKEEKRERNEENRQHKEEKLREHREKVEARLEEVREHREEKRAEHREKVEARHEAVRERWNQRLEELKQ